MPGTKSPASRISRLDSRWTPVLAAGLAAAFARATLFSRLAGSDGQDRLTADGRLYWNWATALLERNFAGVHPFFMGPLYPYGLALLRRIAGVAPVHVVALQFAGGVVAAMLVAWVLARVLPPRQAIAPAIMLAAWEHLMFYDSLVLMESWLWLLAALLLALTVPRPPRRLGESARILAALVVGLMAQGRATSAVLFMPLALVGHEPTAPWGVRARQVAGVVAVAILTMAPSAWHNLRTSGEWIPYTYNAGYNLYVGNQATATGGYVSPRLDDSGSGSGAPGLSVGADEGGMKLDGRDEIVRRGHPPIAAAESSRWWSARAWEWITAHPADAARLTGRKLLMLASRHEYWQLESPIAQRIEWGAWGVPHGVVILVLLTLWPLGALEAWRAGGWTRFPVLAVVFLALATAPFFVTDRYRLHLLPFAIVLAALAGRRLIAAVSARTTRALAPPFAWMAVGAALAFWPLPHRTPVRAEWTARLDLGQRALAAERTNEALAHLARAVDLQRSEPAPAARDGTAARIVAVLYGTYALALTESGRDDEALAWFREADALAPSSGELTLVRGRAQAMAGRFDEARASLREVGVDPDREARELFARAFESNRGGGANTERLLRAAHGLSPAYAPATGVLVRWLCNSARAAEAESLLAHAELSPRARLAWRAHARLALGDTLGARLAWQAARREPPSDDGGVESALSEITPRLGR